MNKKIKRVIEAFLFIAIIIGFIYIGTRDFTTKIVVDNEKFDHDYENVDKNNVFVYATAQDIYTNLKSGTAIIFLGFPSNKWTGYYAKILNDAAKEAGIEKILYYDFYEDRNMQNATYQSIVLNLSNYLLTDDLGKQDLEAPTLIIVKEGKIIAFDNETAYIVGNLTPEQYWTEYKIGLKKTTIKSMFEEYLR